MSIKREQGKDIDRANDIPYSLDALHRGIRAAEVNIATFEDAINREREQIGQFKWMIDVLEKKKAREEEIKIQLEQQAEAEKEAAEASEQNEQE